MKRPQKRHRKNVSRRNQASSKGASALVYGALEPRQLLDAEAYSLLVNGKFEEVNSATLGLVSADLVPGWNASPDANGNRLVAITQSNTTHGNVLRLDSRAGHHDRLFQDVEVTSGQKYLLQFKLLGLGGSTPRSNEVRVLWDGKLVGVFRGLDKWQSLAVEVVAEKTGVSRLEFRETNENGTGGDGVGPLLDCVSLVKVKELAFENGGFEEGPLTPDRVIYHISDIPGWLTDGPVEDRKIRVRSYPQEGPRGRYYHTLDSSANRFDRIFRATTTDDSKDYILTFDIRSPDNSTDPGNQLRIRWNGDWIGTHFASSNWQSNSIFLPGLRDGITYLQLLEAATGPNGMGDGQGPWLDNFELYEIERVTTAPTINLSGPLSYYTNQNLTLTGDVIQGTFAVESLMAQVDLGDLTQVNLDSANRFQFLTSFPLDGTSDGAHVVRFRASDNAGNLSTVATVNIVLDTKRPIPTSNLSSIQRFPTQAIELDFGEAMNPATFIKTNFTLSRVGSGEPAAGISSLEQLSNRRIRLTLDQPLPNGNYRLVWSGAVADLAGNRPTAPELLFAVEQATGITEVSPAAGESLVSLTRETVVRFSRPVDPATINQNSFYLLANGERVAGNIRVSSTEQFATFFYDQPLPPSTQVRIVIDGGQILGRDGLRLDANGDGEPGGLYQSEFRTLPLSYIPGTRVYGYIYDSYNRTPDGRDIPVVGATVSLDANPSIKAVTDANGYFELGIPNPGQGIPDGLPSPDFFVHIDGSTALNAPNGAVYATLGKPFHSVPGQRVPLKMDGEVFDVYLPPMSMGDIVPLNPTSDTEVGFGPAAQLQIRQLMNERYPDNPALAEQQAQLIIDNMRVTYPAGSAMNQLGVPATQAMIVPVDPRRLPAPLPPGADPGLVISIQAGTAEGFNLAGGSTNFDVPAPFRFPNLGNSKPETKVLIHSFDHDAGVWTVIGTGTVERSGQAIISDELIGILAPGWHYASTGFEDGRGPCESDECICESDDLPDEVQITHRGVDASNPSASSLMFNASGGSVRQAMLYLNGNLIGHAFGVTGDFSFSFDQTSLPVGEANFELIAIPEKHNDDSCDINDEEDVIRLSVSATRATLQAYATEAVFVRALDTAPLIAAPHRIYVDYDEVSYTVQATSTSKLINVHEVFVTFSWNPDPITSPGDLVLWGETLAYSINGQSVQGPTLVEGGPGIPSHVLTKRAFDGGWYAKGLIIESTTTSLILSGPGGSSPPLFFNPTVDVAIGQSAAPRVLSTNSNNMPLTFSSGDLLLDNGLIYYRYDYSNGFSLFGRSPKANGFRVTLPPEQRYKLYVFDPATDSVIIDDFVSGLSGQQELKLNRFLIKGGLDSDSDGLQDIAEHALGLDFQTADSNNDGITDFAAFLNGAEFTGSQVPPTGQISALSLQGTSEEVVFSTAPGVANLLGLVATGEFGLAIVNASRFDQPVILGQIPLNGYSRDVAFDSLSRMAAVASGEGGLHFVDLTDLMLPRRVRTATVNARQVEFVDGLVLASVGSRISAFDPLSGEMLNSLVIPNAAEVLGLTQEGEFLYAVDAARRLHVIEVNGLQLLARGSVELPQGGDRLSINNGIIYVGVQSTYLNGGFVTVNARNPDSPFVISGSDIGGDFIAPGLAIVPNGSGLGLAVGRVGAQANQPVVGIVDLSDPNNTGNYLTQFPLSDMPRSVAIAAGIGYIATGRSGLTVVNYVSFDNRGQAPTLTIIGPSGTTLQEGQPVTFRADVTDDVQVRSIELLMNGTVVSTDVTAPFELRAVTPTLASGSSTVSFQLRAFDTGGNVSLSDVLTYTLTPDLTPPSMILATPAQGGAGFRVQTITLRFDEPLDETRISLNSFLLTNLGGNFLPGGGDDVPVALDRVELISANRLVVYTSQPLVEGRFRLAIDPSGIADRAGNQITSAINLDFSSFDLDTQNAIAWISDSDGDWNNPGNWSSGEVPGPNDFVIIDRQTTNPRITLSSGNVTIRGIISRESFVMNGGSLTVRESSEIQGRFELTNGSVLTVQGSNTIFRASNETFISGGSLNALNGGQIILPMATSYTHAANANHQYRYFRAIGSGSRIELPNLTNITNGTFYDSNIVIEALSGGVVNLPLVAEIIDPNSGDTRYRAVSITADGVGSLVNLPALVNFMDVYGSGTFNSDGRYSFLKALNGAMINATAFGPPFIGVEIFEETGGVVNLRP